MGKMGISNGPGSLKSVIEPEAIRATVARILLYLVLRKSRSVTIDQYLTNMHCCVGVFTGDASGGEGALAINRS